MNKILIWILDFAFNWLFKIIDTNKDGKLNPEEIKDALTMIENNVKFLKKELKRK